MELVNADKQLSVDALSFARSYQLEALVKAMKQNTIVFLETGSGKTLIAIMLLRSYAHLLRKPSPFIAVFLVPQVVLVPQQAEAVKRHTDLKVGMYFGEMGVDFWNAATWKQEIEKHEVLVMTHQILLDGLRRSFFKLSMIKVLILDECHHARGKHPYACIMTEFYHRPLVPGKSDLPRIFGMTASPIKSKGGNAELTYWKSIQELENLMNSKVYTCASESVLAEYIPISTPKFKFYGHRKILPALYVRLENELKSLKEKHEHSLRNLDLDKSAIESAGTKMSKAFAALIYCVDELGLWFAWKAAESLSLSEDDCFSWGKIHASCEAIVKRFCSDAYRSFANYIPSGPEWSIVDDVQANVAPGLVTAKVVCLIESLLEYRGFKDIRCIIFVERVVAAVVLQLLLSELLLKHNSWKTKYIAGSSARLQSQTRKEQNKIVEEFRSGVVNIIVATSILEEGLDVQNCNLVIRFDPSSTVCSFIQSRGRARMKNSDYILMVKSGDTETRSRLEKYLVSGDIMREESLRHASLPCAPLENDYFEESYCVESTGATVTLSSSVNLIYFYCAKLPSDGYSRPAPTWDKETCTLHLPKSCPIDSICVEGNTKIMKQKACLEACKRLHQIAALTDNLVPEIVVEEAVSQEFGNRSYDDEQPSYVPPELINCCPKNSSRMYHCYLIELKQNFHYDIPAQNLVLLLRNELQSEIGSMSFHLDVDRGTLMVKFKYVGVMDLNPQMVLISRKFQVTLFRILCDHNWNKFREALDRVCLEDDPEIDYLLLPSNGREQKIIDWEVVLSALFLSGRSREVHKNCSEGRAHSVQTVNGPVCICRLQNSVVFTPHNGQVYCITGTLDLDGNSFLRLRNGQVLTYKDYYKLKHGVELLYSKESLLKGRQIFTVHNYLQRCRLAREKGAESSNAFVELPPELCCIIMSPISVNTLYSFSFAPAIMHRLESLLIAVNLKQLHLDHCMQNDIPAIKVLEALTTKKCQENFHLESLETLGDSFLKYATSQQLFKTYQSHHEGLLSAKKDRIVCNASLCQLGCDSKLPGFIRNEPFDPKTWIIPGDKSKTNTLREEPLSDTRKVYIRIMRKVKNKSVADVVEALIGAFLSSTGGEIAALKFMSWIGIKVDFDFIPYERPFKVNAENLINVKHFESLLNYKFHDPSLLLEALTHGSYMLPQSPRCYQRLEFLGDSVLDYLMTVHLYNKYPGMSPGFLTDMRSASVNNDCYARCSVKAELHKHILHLSSKLHKDIVRTLQSFKTLSSETTFGWESETSFPKVLGDVIESLAGAILVDSGYNKERVFESIRPLLEPLITPETVMLHPVRELNELCQKEHYINRKPIVSRHNGVASLTIEVEVDGTVYKHTSSASGKEIAKKVACKEVLKLLKKIHLNEASGKG